MLTMYICIYISINEVNLFNNVSEKKTKLEIHSNQTELTTRNYSKSHHQNMKMKNQVNNNA